MNTPGSLMSPPVTTTAAGWDCKDVLVGDLELFAKVCDEICQAQAPRSPWSVPELIASVTSHPPTSAEIAHGRRALKHVENNVRFSGESVKLFDQSRAGIHGVTLCGQELHALLVAQRDLASQYQTRGDILRLSVAETFATYVLPEVVLDRSAIDEAAESPVPFQIARSDPKALQLGGDLHGGRIDAMIGWPQTLRGLPDAIDRTLRAESIALSRIRFNLVFHASHPFARAAAEWDANGLQPTTEELHDAFRTDYRVYYPSELTAVRGIAAGLFGADACLPTEGFPAVLAHVRMGSGLGLFPALPGTLRRLRVEDHVYNVSLPAESQQDTSLVVYTRKDMPINCRQRLDKLLKEVVVKFRGDGEKSEWEMTEWDNPFDDGSGGFLTDWDVYYINRGSRAMPYPRWRFGNWKFDPPGPRPEGGTQPLPVTGTYSMKYQADKRPLPFRLDGRLTPVSLTVTSTPEDWGELDGLRPYPSTITFVQILRPTHGPTRGEKRIVVGSISTARWGTATVAPFFLCPKRLPLGPRTLRQLAGLIEFHPRAPGFISGC